MTRSKPTFFPSSLTSLTALALLAGGCGLEEPLDDLGTDPVELELEDDDPGDANPDPGESSDPSLVDELAPPPAPESTEVALCGLDPQFQDVESYDGTLGPSTDFVDIHERPVARLRWASDLGDRYDDLYNVAGDPECTGTMVSNNLLLTAGHCINNSKFRLFGGGLPSPEQAALELVVEFRYQNKPDGTPRAPKAYAVEALVERFSSDILGEQVDYAVLRVEDNPGLRWGYAKLAYGMPALNSILTIIQHPNGVPKVVEAGHYDGLVWSDGWFPVDYEWVASYDDIDTLGGSSGAGVLDASGRIMGVHSIGWCAESPFYNAAEPITEIVATSDVLDDLLWGDIPLVGDIDGGGDDLVIYRPTDHRWYGLHPDGTHVFPVTDEPAWGAGGDVPMLGDLDGDGFDEMIQWRPSTGKWYALRADGSRVWPPGTEPSWGSANAKPLVGDLDGDGEDEIIVWEPLDRKWYAKYRDGSRVWPQGSEWQWGTRDDVPLIGDLDGDGADEMIMFRTTNNRWYGLRMDGSRVRPQGTEWQWGSQGDIPMIANFDSLGGDDMVVWRPSNGKWYALRNDGTRVFPQGAEPSFGVDGDVPLVGNFNGLGADNDDMAFWRPSTARWSGRNFWGAVLFDDLQWGFPY